MSDRIEIVTDDERFRQIAPHWHLLWRESQAGVFQAHGWINAWWTECDKDYRLRIVCAWHRDQLVAVLPLCVRRWRGVRVLEWAAQAYSDYCDVMLQDSADGLLAVMWAAIEAIGGYDLIRLKHVRPDAAIRRLLSQVASEERTEVCLQLIRAWPNGEMWFRTLNKKTRNNLSRGRRILDEHGDITFRQLGADEPRQPVIARLLALKRYWKENRDSPMVRSDSVLLALVDALDQLGSLRIFLVEHAGTIIAGSVNAIHQDKMLAVFATYDSTYERASPGILVIADYTRWAFDHGIVEVDYLLGTEPYKFKFANQDVRVSIFVAGKTVIGRVALAAWRQRRQPADPDILIGSAYRTEKGTDRGGLPENTVP
jgi:CelD/BcsL family acetyltransferase involved in cellulose biosynthesis